jgi:hypothetical protein
MSASKKTNTAKAQASTVPQADTITMTVASIDEGAKGGAFVRFVANSKGIQWQVYMTHAKIASFNINEGSELTMKASSIKQAFAYDSTTRSTVVDAEGKPVLAPIVYGYTNASGEEVRYKYGKGTLDIGVKVVSNKPNTNIGEAQARGAFDPR